MSNELARLCHRAIKIDEALDGNETGTSTDNSVFFDRMRNI